MPVGHHIRNPFEVGVGQAIDSVRDLFRPHARRAETTHAEPVARRITASDIWASLREGMGDLGAYRSDILFMGIFYPLAGLLLFQIALGGNLLVLAFPLLAGFALVGPICALGLYEISLRREQGAEVTWQDAFGVFRAPGFPAIVRLSLLMVALFLVWMAAAYQVFLSTIGPVPPRSVAAFINEIFYTQAGLTMLVVGCAVGFVFAAVVLLVSAFSFPLLLDKDLRVREAVAASVAVARKNPGVVALWGLTVAGLLILGSLPVLVGLIVVVPLLGHATWRLYRRAISFE
jgi:uncharacterized membrane protein